MRAITLAAVAAAATAPAAVAAPVTVTPLPLGPLGPQGLVAAERVGPHRVHLTILQTSGVTARLALVPGGCRTRPDGVILRVRAPHGRVIELTRRLPTGRVSWLSRSRRQRTVCVPQPRRLRRGAVVVPRDPDTGRPNGVVTLQGPDLRLSSYALFAGRLGSGGRWGPSTTACGEEPDFAWSVELDAPGNVVTPFSGLPPSKPATWESIALVGRRVAACVKWELSEFDLVR